jgi:hypothetical protein
MWSLHAHWPTWYFALIAYTAYLAVGALRYQARVVQSIRSAAPIDISERERAYAAGRQVGIWMRAGSWLIAALLLLIGTSWSCTLVAIGYGFSARASFREYARGFAEGRKAAELAAAPEYVRGRITPQPPDLLAAAVITLVLRIAPAVASLYMALRLRP